MAVERIKARFRGRFEREVARQFHKMYYEHLSRTWHNTYWLGVRVKKCPLDLWLYQEMLHTHRPDVLIEAGTCEGGSALFFASLFDLLGHGHVITLDIRKQPNLPAHKRITYLEGSSVSKEVRKEVARRLKSLGGKVMVVLDSDHRKDHVLEELRLFSPFVSRGQYLVVEDTNVNGHPVDPGYGPGPMEALDEFLKTNRNFVVDRSLEKFYLTFNPRGYLKRV